MKTTYRIIFNDDTTCEAQRGLRNWASTYAENSEYPKDVKAICYDTEHREVYLSGDAVSQLNDEVYYDYNLGS